MVATSRYASCAQLHHLSTYQPPPEVRGPHRKGPILAGPFNRSTETVRFSVGSADRRTADEPAPGTVWGMNPILRRQPVGVPGRVSGISLALCAGLVAGSLAGAGAGAAEEPSDSKDSSSASESTSASE